jgi:catechol-2,3-dioxygenase
MINSPKKLNIALSHMGIAVVDLRRMEEFYTNVLGFTVTDRGNELGMDIVFMSRDPDEHHQIVLATGRPRNLPLNTDNPLFGPCVFQVSFKLPDLASLRAIEQHLISIYSGAERIYANHGTAWSIYVPDPEGNMLELYVASGWYCKQPCFAPLDLSLTDDEIAEQTLSLAQGHGKFEAYEGWRSKIAREMAGDA